MAVNIDDNPYIPKEKDYFDGYNESIKKNFDPKALYYQKITFQLFSTPQGKEWLAQYKKILSLQFVDLGAVNSELFLAQAQGAKIVIHGIEQTVNQHKQHIEAKGGS